MQSGLYDDFINELLERQLDQLPQEAQKELALAETEEIPLLLSRYLKTLFEAFLSRQDPSFLSGAPPLDLANAFIASLGRADDSLLAYQLPKPPLRLLRGLAKPGHSPYQQVPGAKGFSLIRPESPMAYSSLFTGSRHEPALYSEFKKELASCDRADFLVSFLRWSGVRLIYEDLKRFTDLGGKLRILTTSYMGATDPKAVDALASLRGTTLRISYDTQSTRLHAKAYIFHRNSGLSCAYIGSSNLSRVATTTGSEWNVKVCAKDSLHMLEKISATFAAYWNAPSYETYDASQKERLEKALAREKSGPEGSPLFFDLHPYAFQQDILDQIQAERTVYGRWKNLVVSATGTGKTMIAAFDFREYRKINPGATFLFLAHREEILRRSREAFRGVLKDENFGDLWVGGEVPSDPRSLFLSVQMAAAKNITRYYAKDFFDYIVVDEFHHAAAATYEELLQHFTPKILLGLTATPERMDGEDILGFFEGHMACELRLPEAIAQNLLCPFQYFGVADPADLSRLKWTRGGYEPSELTDLYVFSREIAKKRADYIVRALDRTVTDLTQTKALAFCVSKEHARFMAEHFQASGINALALTSDTPGALRQSARKDLDEGRLNILCVVDLYNEGVDIPAINTLLFLRPTQSLTIFLQQLGRGLRHSPGKDCLTVLDFIGQQHKNYAFSEKFSALLHRKGRSLYREMKEGFPGLPPNCYIQLEKVPAQILEANLRQVVGRQSYLQQLIEEAAQDLGPECSLEEFLAYWAHHGKVLSPREIYRYKRSFYNFKRLLNLVASEGSPYPEAELAAGFLRLSSINSRRWLEFLLEVLSCEDPLSNLLPHLSPTQWRWLKMFQVSFRKNGAALLDEAAIAQTLTSLRDSSRVREELQSLLRFLLNHIHFVDEPVALDEASALDLHCDYSRDQLLVGLGFDQPSSVREGVKYLPELPADVLLNTLMKSEKDYSPTTLYKDYSINDHLFHWQSQSTTSEHSPTGARYVHHDAQGSQILLFVRERKSDGAGSLPFTFLGKAHYVSHEGSRPMSIIWRMERPIPARFLEVSSTLGVMS